MQVQVWPKATICVPKGIQLGQAQPLPIHSCQRSPLAVRAKCGASGMDVFGPARGGQYHEYVSVNGSPASTGSPTGFGVAVGEGVGTRLTGSAPAVA